MDGHFHAEKDLAYANSEFTPHYEDAPAAIDEREARDKITQDTFVGAIEALRKNQVAELPNLADSLDQQGQRTKGLTDLFNLDSHRVFLSPDFISTGEKAELPDRVSFTPQPTLRLGREDSYQDVFFGNLEIACFNTGASRTSQIAVKPIKDQGFTEERLLHEAAMYQYMQRIGVPTVELAGVMLFDNPQEGIKGFVVTEFDPELTTLDTFPWHKFSDDEKINQLMYGVDSLALLNSYLLFHGDGEFKNIGVTDSGASIKMVDLEYGSALAGEQDNVKLIAQRMSHDFACLTLSVQKYILPTFRRDTATNDVERFNILHNLVYEPYLQRIIQLQSDHLAVLRNAYDIVIEQKARQATGEW